MKLLYSQIASLVRSDLRQLSERLIRNSGCLLLLSSILFFSACPENHIRQRDTTIHLSLAHAGTFAVSLKVSVEDSSEAWTFALTRDDSTVQTILSDQPDTLVTDGGLLPGQTYRYRAYWLEDGEKTDSSEEVLAATLDTTSHNFVWEIDTLGDYGSYLNDVAVIDENDVWVVGLIRTNEFDSISMTNYTDYNAAHWNGSEWELIGIYGNTLDLHSVQYFNEDDIWVLASYPIHWDGNEWTHFHLTDMGIIPGGLRGEIWGSDPNDVYFVGSSGRIVHYDGSTFTRMDSGTDVDLKDITGTPDGEHVFAVGWDSNIPAPCVVLELNNGIWNTLYYTEGSLPSEGNVGWVWSVGVLNDTVYLPASAGLWEYDYVTQDSVLIPNAISYMDRSAFKGVHIKSTNDIFFAGSGFKYNYFNGNSFFYSHEITDMYPQRAMLGSDYNDNLAVMVGYFNWWEGALIAKGFHE